MDVVSALETALGAELLRADMLGASRPKVAGRYVIAGFLGRGATGLVVAAVDETLARRVALKLSPVGADATIAEEARALAKLDHPNVVRIFDAIATDLVLDGKPFRVWAVSMQLVEGVTMRAWLRDAKPVPSQIVRVMRDAGAGLAAAHAQRVVHRDFKPENVLIRADGVAQVIDFGFAVPQRSSVGATTSDVAGTAPYLAPEAKLGHATPRSDQFAFGITLVEALTGDPTPPGRTPPSGVSRGLWRLARRACAPRAEARYPDMASLLAELDPAKANSRWRPPSPAVLVILAGLFAARFAWQSWNDRPASPVTAAPGPVTASSAADRCAAVTGRWLLTTRVDRRDDGDAPAIGVNGFYELVLSPAGTCVFTADLRQTGDTRVPRYREPIDRSPSEPVRAVLDVQGFLWLSVEDARSPRSYRLGFDGGSGGTGVFEASGFGGTITDVSRFDPLAGHDARRPE